jgi:hypothetical protein
MVKECGELFLRDGVVVGGVVHVEDEVDLFVEGASEVEGRGGEAQVERRLRR